jgi:hypothetical protein
VHLNVIVRGGHCRPVRDLEQPDFSVAEDGVSGVVRDARLIESGKGPRPHARRADAAF